MDYWGECIREAFEDANIEATKEQIDTVIAWVEGAVENESMARGYDVIGETPSQQESRKIRELKKELEEERRLVECDMCFGRGIENIRVSDDKWERRRWRLSTGGGTDRPKHSNRAALRALQKKVALIASFYLQS